MSEFCGVVTCPRCGGSRFQLEDWATYVSLRCVQCDRAVREIAASHLPMGIKVTLTGGKEEQEEPYDGTSRHPIMEPPPPEPVFQARPLKAHPGTHAWEEHDGYPRHQHSVNGVLTIANPRA